MLKIENVTKTFGRKTALNDLSLTLNPGIIGLLGPNGAGKTTLLRTITGLHKVKKGKLFLDDKEATNNGVIPSVTGYLPQKFGMFKELKVREMMEYFSVLKKIPKEKQKAEIERCLEFVNLSDRAQDKVGSLSGGMVRRLGISQAILGDTRIILFDEPTAGLDPEERQRFKNLVRQLSKEKIVVISTHIVEDVEAVCDHVMVMGEGSILANVSCMELAKIAEGKVYRVSADNEENLPEGAFVRTRNESEAEGTTITVLSKMPVEGGIKMKPTIEDGYMCVLKNIT